MALTRIAPILAVLAALALAPAAGAAQPPEPEPGPVLGRAGVGQAIAVAAHHLTPAERRRLCRRTIDGLCRWPANERPWALVTGFGDRETRIDPRIRNDAIAIGRRYRVAYWDCLGGHPPHIINGEHPIGVACDIVPDRSRGGTWGRVQQLARDYGRRLFRPRPVPHHPLQRLPRPRGPGPHPRRAAPAHLVAARGGRAVHTSGLGREPAREPDPALPRLTGRDPAGVRCGPCAPPC